MTVSGSRAKSDIEAWLIEDARNLPTIAAVLNEFCQRLNVSGIPIYRLSLSIPTLHPQIDASGFRWLDGAEELVQTDIDFSIRQTDRYLRSPFKPIFEGSAEVRCAIPAEGPLPYPILDDLRTEGATDYLVLPLRFSVDRINVISVATREPGGFTDDVIKRYKSLLPLLSLVLEIKEDQRVAQNLLQAYLGRDAGQRVLGGLVRRGEGSALAAALWYCDLRGFTKLSNDAPRETVIETLNAYFDVMAGPVEAHGGEILKFIGDAMLAIFPIKDDLDRDRACLTALRAGEEAVADLRTLNFRRAEENLPELTVGVALHTGAVTYGNIGTQRRLDFTVIGPAVNLVTRIESLCPILNRPLLASDRFASPCGSRMIPLGAHRFKGIDEPQLIYGLPD